MLVHPWHDGFEERGDLGVSAVGGSELGDPDWEVAADGRGVLDLVLEVCGVGVRVVLQTVSWGFLLHVAEKEHDTNPVNSDKVNSATIASIEESSEPVETHGTTSVGDSRCTELSLTCIRLHVSLVSSGGGLRGQVRLAAVVRLVERHEMSAASSKCSGNSIVPARGKGIGSAPYILLALE